MAGDPYEQFHERDLREQGLSPEEAHAELMKSREVVKVVHVWSEGNHIAGRPLGAGQVVQVTRREYEEMRPPVGEHPLEESIEAQLTKYGRVRFADRPRNVGDTVYAPEDAERHSVTPKSFRDGWDTETEAAKRPAWVPFAHEIQRAANE